LSLTEVSLMPGVPPQMDQGPHGQLSPKSSRLRRAGAQHRHPRLVQNALLRDKVAMGRIGVDRQG
jgi:hypothetical protein